MHGDMTDWRWASFKNEAGETVPAYGLCRVTSRPGVAEYAITKPNVDSLDGLFVNGDVDIPSSIGTDPGKGNLREPYLPAPILYNPADGLPTAGELWGAASGEWWLRKNRKQQGYRILGVDATQPSKLVWAIPVNYDCCVTNGGDPFPSPAGCDVDCSGPWADCMRVDFIDPDGLPGSILMSSLGGSTGGHGDVVWTFSSGQLPIQSGRFYVSGFLSCESGAGGFITHLEFYVRTIIQAGPPPTYGLRLVEILGGATCPPGYPYKPNGQWPLPPQWMHTGPNGSPVVGSPAKVTVVTPAPGACSGGAGGVIDPGGIIGGGGGGQQSCLDQCTQVCTDAYGYPDAQCVNQCYLACIGGGGVSGTLKSASGGCACGTPGCSSCSVVSPSALSPVNFTLWSAIDFAQNLITAQTVQPLSQSSTNASSVGAGEENLATHNIQANVLAINDQSEINVIWKIVAGRPRLYVGGIKIYDSGLGLVNTVKTLRVILSRTAAGTARAMVLPSGENPQYVDETTLTGLNFGASLTVQATGQGTGTPNDIQTVISSVNKITAPTGVVASTGSSFMQILSFGPADQVSVPLDAAGYSGAGASKLSGGPAAGSSEVDVSVVPTASISAGQIVRLFKKIGGTLLPAGQFDLPVRNSNASDPKWQEPIPLTRIRLTASTEEIWISKEKNEGLLGRGERSNYQT
jgi:hypothetical protein